MYYAECNGKKFFATNDKTGKCNLNTAVVTIIAGGAGNFKFDVPSDNAYAGKFKRIKDYVDVYRNKKIIFSGRITNIIENEDLSEGIVCEGIRAILNDSMLRPETYRGNLHGLLRMIVANHNEQTEQIKNLTIGRITVKDQDIYRKYEIIESTKERLDALCESYGGRIEIRKEPKNAVLYIDWLESFDEGCDQVIDFGSNMLDIQKSIGPEIPYTYLIPEGAADDDGIRINIKDVNGGLDYVAADQKYIDEYGKIFGKHTWEDVTLPSNLKKKAIEYVNAICAPVYTINVTAVDLADAGYKVGSFHPGQRLKVRSLRHGIYDFFDCVEQRLDLKNPASNVLTLGQDQIGYVERANMQNSQRNAVIEKIIKTYSSKSAMELAIENATSLITGNTGGYVVMHDADGDGEPDEILIMDTPSIDTAVKIWRWNKNGLGYSSTGYNGTFGMAITADGSIVADFITSGSMSAERLKAGVIRAQRGDTYWDLDTGLFHLGSGDFDTDKSKNFTYKPVPPYFTGDLWITNKEVTTAVAGYAIAGQAIAGKEGKLQEGGQIMVCVKTKQEGEYDPDNWVLLTNYIDTDELKQFEERVRKAEINIVTTNERIDTKLDNTFATEQLQVNTQIRSVLNSHSGMIEQKADKTVVSGLNETVSGIDAKFDADGLIELKTYRKEVGEQISEKSKTFRETPYAPYETGDIWITSVTDKMNAFAGVAIAGVAIAGFGNDIYVADRRRTEADGFRFSDWIKATDYVSDDQLKAVETRISSAEIAIDAAKAAIELKASQTIVNGISDRVQRAEINLDAAKAAIELKASQTIVNGISERVKNAEIAIDAANEKIEQKVSVTEFNGTEIISKIVQTPYSVQIDAGHIGIGGKVSLNDVIIVDGDEIYADHLSIKGVSESEYTYTYADRDRIQQIIMGTVSPTENDYKKLDINGDGRITTLDYNICQQIIDMGGKYTTYVDIEPNSSRDVISIADNIGNTTHIGANALTTQTLVARRVMLSESLFKIEKVTVGPYKLSGIATQVYHKEDAVTISVPSGYELVGTSGYNIRPESGSTAIMCNVYMSYCDGEKFNYGVTNTGVNDQTIYVDFYLILAHTKEKYKR